jgi:hypothetical protein
MIVEMKKVTLLCTRASREVTLDALRDLGAVHLQHVTSPEGEGLEQARRHFEYLRRVLEVLPKHPDKAPSGKSAHDVVEDVWKLIHRKQALIEKIELLEIESRRYEPFGQFDVDDILALREQGLQIKLLHAPIKQLPDLPEDATLVELDRDRTSAYFVLISREPVEIDAEELPLPECSVAGMIRHIEGLQKELAEVEEGFSELPVKRKTMWPGSKPATAWAKRKRFVTCAGSSRPSARTSCAPPLRNRAGPSLSKTPLKMTRSRPSCAMQNGCVRLNRCWTWSISHPAIMKQISVRHFWSFSACFSGCWSGMPDTV